MAKSFSNLALSLIQVFETREKDLGEEKIAVNDLVARVASFYEKFRTAMDYGNEETIPRRAIVRMLKRMLILEQNPKEIAKDLVHELVWAGYFTNTMVSQAHIEKAAISIENHLKLRGEIIKLKILKNEDISGFIIDLLSCDLFFTLIPNREKEAVGNFMFRTLKDSVNIEDDSSQNKDIQVFIAIRKSFNKDDVAFLRYKLFVQIFGKLSSQNLEETVKNFEKGYKEIKYQLHYPRKDRILSHIKKVTPGFLILYDILLEERGRIRGFTKEDLSFKSRVFAACNRRYISIKRKVRTAIIRSFIFILFTKAIIAFAIEGTFESIFLGSVAWFSIVLNTIIPPIIMALVGIGISTPDQQNSEKIYSDIDKLLFIENPQIIPVINVKLKSNALSLKDYVFSVLWLLSTGLMFGIILYILGLLHFNILSKGIFIFFIAIISFLSYRIYQTASSYTVFKKQNVFTPIFDFFFVPIIRVGRHLTEGIVQINFLLMVVDFIIEAPFKGIIGFFEQWFLFVAAKREELE